MPDTPVVPHRRFTFASVYSLLGLFGAMVVHTATFTSFSLSPDNPIFWILHIGIFPVSLSMVFSLTKWSERRRGPFGLPTSRLRWRELRAYLPPWTVVAGKILLVYVVINFLLTMLHLSAANHAAAGATPALDPEQARYTVRAFSGHWLMFYTVLTLYYLFVPPTALSTDSARQAAV